MLITLNLQGATPEEIREACKQFAELGASSSAVITPGDFLEQEANHKRRKIIGGKTWTDAEGETARVLYENGSNWKEIAAAINRTYGNNRTPDAVREYFKRLKAKED